MNHPTASRGEFKPYRLMKISTHQQKQLRKNAGHGCGPSVNRQQNFEVFLLIDE
jgi:hypothetical protein